MAITAAVVLVVVVAGLIDAVLIGVGLVLVLVGILVLVLVLVLVPLGFLIVCDFVVVVVVIDGVGVGAFVGVCFVVRVFVSDGVVVVVTGLLVVVVARVGAPTESFLTTGCGVCACVSCDRGLL